MSDLNENISCATVTLPSAAYRDMLELVKLLDQLWQNVSYQEQVYAELPDAARFDPGHASAMMCYDFHLAGETPRLIEVNTNAGGGLLACLACNPEMSVDTFDLPDDIRQHLIAMFADELKSFSSGSKMWPGLVVIIDDKPQEQHLYPEMLAFAKLFETNGADVAVVEPRELSASAQGVLFRDRPVDMLYNRHCDFYLETDVMLGIRAAYLNGQVCLTPNPHMYGLLADKRRMTLWNNVSSQKQWGLAPDDKELLSRVVPSSELLADVDPVQLWAERKKYAFKPVDSFGSRGVLLGEKISRKRFDELPPHRTLVQEMVPPSKTEVPDYGPMKTDFRLYAYRDRPFGVTARLYRGQVTNLRTPGGGFARVEIS